MTIKSCCSCKWAEIYRGRNGLNTYMMVDCDFNIFIVPTKPLALDLKPYEEAAEKCGRYKEVRVTCLKSE